MIILNTCIKLLICTILLLLEYLTNELYIAKLSWGTQFYFIVNQIEE